MRSPEVPARRMGASFVVLSSFIAVLAGLGAYRVVDDPDLFWHLKIGEAIWAEHAIPRVDVYSFTFAGRPFTTDWASELLMAVSYKLGGEFGLFLLAALLSAATMAFVALRMRTRARPFCLSFAVALLLLVYDVAAFRFTPRPQTFLFVGLGALLWLFESAAEQGSLRRLIWLPVIVLIWSNLHISASLALVFAGTIAVGYGIALRGRWRTEIAPHWRWLVLLTTATLAAFLAVPDPIARVHTAVGTLFSRSYTTGVLSEWHAPALAVWAGPAGALLLATALAILVAWRRWKAHEILICAIAGWLGMRHVRFLPIFALVIGPIVYRHLAAAIAVQLDRRPHARTLHVVDQVLAIILVGGFAFGALGLDNRSAWLGGTGRPHGRLVGAAYPVGATQFMATAQPRGAMYNTFHFGGYLIYHLGPSVKVFIDGRTGNLYDDAHVRDMMEIRQRWPEIFARWQIQYAITQPGELDESLARDPRWSLIYFDDAAFVFVRNEGDNAALAKRLGYHALVPPFVATPQGAEGIRVALQEADRAVTAAPSSALAHILRGRVRGMSRDLKGFVADMRTAQGLDPSRPEPWQRLGLWALSLHQPAEAIRNLRRACELSPHDDSIRMPLASAYLAAGDETSARAALLPSVRPDRTLEQMLATIRQRER